MSHERSGSEFASYVGAPAPSPSQQERIASEAETAFGDSDPPELIAASEARLAHLRMAVRRTLIAMGDERWEAARDFLVDSFEREEHARRRQEGEELQPFWFVQAQRQQRRWADTEEADLADE